MGITVCGPNRSNCGVSLTTRLWTESFDDAGHGVSVIRPECLGSEFVSRITNTEPPNVFFLDYSSDVIDPVHARRFLELARDHSYTTVVRIHSQKLQGMRPDNADWFCGPFDYVRACEFEPGCEGGHISEVPKSKFLMLPHPVGPGTPFLNSVDPNLVVSLGRPERVPQAYVQEVVEGMGLHFRALADGSHGAEWDPESIVMEASRAAVVVIWYSPIRGVGQSSVLSLALASGRPVVASNCEFLMDAWPWSAIDDLETAISRARATGIHPGQIQYTNSFHVIAIGRKLLNMIGC